MLVKGKGCIVLVHDTYHTESILACWVMDHTQWLCWVAWGDQGPHTLLSIFMLSPIFVTWNPWSLFVNLHWRILIRPWELHLQLWNYFFMQQNQIYIHGKSWISILGFYVHLWKYFCLVVQPASLFIIQKQNFIKHLRYRPITLLNSTTIKLLQVSYHIKNFSSWAPSTYI